MSSLVDVKNCLYNSAGAELPPVKEKTEHFDSNCITPVSGCFVDLNS